MSYMVWRKIHNQSIDQTIIPQKILETFKLFKIIQQYVIYMGESDWYQNYKF